MKECIMHVLVFTSQQLPMEKDKKDRSVQHKNEHRTMRYPRPGVDDGFIMFQISCKKQFQEQKQDSTGCGRVKLFCKHKIVKSLWFWQHIYK